MEIIGQAHRGRVQFRMLIPGRRITTFHGFVTGVFSKTKLPVLIDNDHNYTDFHQSTLHEQNNDPNIHQHFSNHESGIQWS